MLFRNVTSPFSPRPRSVAVGIGVLFFLAAVFLPALSAQADEPTVTAVLTSSETEVDRPVQLQIKITGDANAIPPNEITVDGLDIRYTGQSQLVEGRNFRFTYSFVYNYTILPLKAGTFTIPSQAIGSNNGTLRTPALTLNVAPNDDGTTTSRRGGGNSATDEKKIVFAELVVPKTSVYVGETIPAQIRIGINSRVPHRFIDLPNLSGQGFTSQRMPNPDQRLESIGGRTYEVVTLQTAITPVRSGKLEISAKDAKAIIQVPRRGGSRPRSPFDLFGMNDPFNDPFFNDAFAGVGEQKEVKFSSETTTIEVKPLPPNAPATFAGAVGNFSLATDVKPKTAQVGDPLTVTATISGRGNFDRVTAPTLEETRGWHTYPPGSNFKADDEIGVSGTKTFEMVVTPNEPKKAVPPLVFTFFNPLKEQYVTLKGDKVPVVVEGGTAPAATPAVASAGTPPPQPSARPTAAPQGSDILYQLTDHGGWGATFAPVFQQPVFWAAQAVPLLGLVGFFGWEMRRRRLANRAGQRIAAWENESAELERKLRRAGDPPDQYYAEALRVVQLKTALARQIEPNTVDAEIAVAAFDLPDEQRDRVRELFRRSDEVRYSGRPNGNSTVPEETRREVLDLINRLN
ncbi:MAG: protein BatD [Chthoniobacterales bacterium]|nr:protein BatD [Chthoniobacterales bacterium]